MLPYVVPKGTNPLLDIIAATYILSLKGLRSHLSYPKHGPKGFWSRRITGEHRLVYKVYGKKGIDQKCTIIQCRFHYDDK
uniref:type II toxin-antitoxin system YoeB family toxin n=1 Tax=Mariniflexile sp. TaxID=1979402 RepID=UPI004048681E